MTLDDLMGRVGTEPPRTVTLQQMLSQEQVTAANRPGGMLLSDLLAAAPRSLPQHEVRFGHILGPPASPEALDAWTERFPRHALPADLKALVARVNGIHLWANLDTGRSYEGLAPLEEWALARVKLYGQGADARLLPDHYLTISYHSDSAAFVVLNVESGRYFLMDSGGPDETCPIGSSVSELLDWLWRTRIPPKPNSSKQS
jgi:hypothetical protein